MRDWWTAESKTEDKVGGKAEFGFDNRGRVRKRQGKYAIDKRLICDFSPFV